MFILGTVSKILAVDDVPENLLLLCDVLEERGYHIRLASDGESVLRNVADYPPDLILLDIRLSGMNGYQVCSHLKSNPETRDIPIIFLSALEDPKVKVKAFQTGGVDYITKPFQVEEVIARIENQLTIKRQKEELENLQEQLLDSNEILEQQNRHLKLLLKLTQLMNTARDLEEAIAQVLNQLCPAINWHYGEAWILNDQETELIRSHHRYATSGQVDQIRHRSESTVYLPEWVNQIAHSQRIEWIADRSQLDSFDQHQQQDPSPFQKLLDEVGLTSLLGIPIVFKGKVLAVLILLADCSYDQKEGASVPSYSPDWLDLIRSVANQLGTLMQRLRTERALKEANERLHYLAAYDGLTQVANRRRFDEYLNEQWRQGKRDRGELSLILCDLDAFKHYNDELGHQQGDRCLQQVANVLAQLVKRPMDLVARYGGEELAVLLPYTAQIGAFQLGEQICHQVKALQLPHPNSPVSHYVTVSVGVSSLIPRDDCSPKMLVRLADQALYQAKQMGRDRVALSNQLSEEVLNL